LSKKEARAKGISQFFNCTAKRIQVADSGGEVTVGPFLPGSKSLGPWYSIDELSPDRFERWQRTGLIKLVERK